MSESGSLVHVVLVKWREGLPSRVLDEIGRRVAGFTETIDGVVDAVEGSSVSSEDLEGGFDWGLVVTFADAVARDGYLDHPEHLPVSAAIGEWSERVVVFDLAR
ncbi:Dabb family protein [Demequina salsinemoris]|uniref:Dabb family protein n=1 Tax=Demequina salsinemoris TaxID=577470 RepID=UPI0007853A85|nr:Dabb family protein [Demequina salsinemoris]